LQAGQHPSWHLFFKIRQPLSNLQLSSILSNSQLQQPIQAIVPPASLSGSVALQGKELKEIQDRVSSLELKFNEFLTRPSTSPLISHRDSKSDKDSCLQEIPDELLDQEFVQKPSNARVAQNQQKQIQQKPQMPQIDLAPFIKQIEEAPIIQHIVRFFTASPPQQRKKEESKEVPKKEVPIKKEVSKEVVVKEPIKEVPIKEASKEVVVKDTSLIPFDEEVEDKIAPSDKNKAKEGKEDKLNMSSPYVNELKLLSDMGFADVDKNLMLLYRCGGNVSEVISALLL
jgi:hypothetical protein